MTYIQSAPPLDISTETLTVIQCYLQHQPRIASWLAGIMLSEVSMGRRLLALQAVLQGEGRHFCVGIDVNSLQTMAPLARQDDVARKSRGLRQHILKLQVLASTILWLSSQPVDNTLCSLPEQPCPGLPTLTFISECCCSNA